jgi:hypothetical protein
MEKDVVEKILYQKEIEIRNLINELNEKQNSKISEIEKNTIIQQSETRKYSEDAIEKTKNRVIKSLSALYFIFTLLALFGLWALIGNQIKNSIDKEYGAKYVLHAKKVSKDLDSLRKLTFGVYDTIQALNQKLTENKWIPAIFLNNWTNFGKDYNPVSFYKDNVGRVYLRGMAKGGKIRNSIFTLPENFRPKFRELFIVKTGNSQTRLDIAPNGDVIILEPFKNWISLDGITFSASTTNHNQIKNGFVE